MKQFLDPRNYIPSNSIFWFGSSKVEEINLEHQQEGTLSLIFDSVLIFETENVKQLILEMKKLKNQLFRETQRIMRTEVELTDKNSKANTPHTPPLPRTLSSAVSPL